MINKGIDPIQTALSTSGQTVKGDINTVNTFLANNATRIDVKDPTVINRFYENMQNKQKAVIAAETARNADYNDVILRHKFERNTGIPVGSLSLSDWKNIQTTQKASVIPSTTTNVLDSVNGTIRAIDNKSSVSTIENITLNQVDPWSSLPKFQSEKSDAIIPLLSSLDGSPLTNQQKTTIDSVIKTLPSGDASTANQFLTLYNKMSTTNEKINTEIKGYDFSDTSKSTIIKDIQEYSNYDPQGAKEYYQFFKDINIGQQIQANNTKITDLSSKTTPYTVELGGKTYPLLANRTTETELKNVLNKNYSLIDQVKTPSLKSTYQDMVNESLTYGDITKKMNNASPEGVTSFTNLVGSLKFASPEQKTELQKDYSLVLDSKTQLGKVDNIVKNAHISGISDQQLADIKKSLNTNSLLTRVNPETGETYSNEIVDSVSKVKAGYWNEEDYRKTAPWDFVTGWGLSVRSSAQKDVDEKGANLFNTALSAFGGEIAFPGMTVYGTARSFGIGGSAKETLEQSSTTHNVIPTFGGVKNAANQPILPYTYWAAPHLENVGKGAGDILFIAAPEKYNPQKEWTKDFLANLISEPAKDPLGFGVNYVVAWGLGKVFTGVMEAKKAKYITPAVVKRADELSEIETALGKISESKAATVSKTIPVTAAKEVFPGDSIYC